MSRRGGVVPARRPSVEELEAEIRQTRAELAETVQALAAKVDLRARARGEVVRLGERVAEAAGRVRGEGIGLRVAEAAGRVQGEGLGARIAAAAGRASAGGIGVRVAAAAGRAEGRGGGGAARRMPYVPVGVVLGVGAVVVFGALVRHGRRG
jgi:hypothetical protein